MRLYAYTVTTDSGFAPNPFHGYCTLATCKSGIRKRADIGDWVFGVGSVDMAQYGKLIFAMRVEEAMWFDDYWADPRFQLKKPNPNGTEESRCGDNIYHRFPDSGDWVQAPGYHSLDNGCPDPLNVEKDTKSPRVLISQHFAYFGRNAPDIPDHIMSHDEVDRFKGIRNYRCNFPQERHIVEWLQDLTRSPGIHGTPTHWKSADKLSC
ncbi:hypothetical protein [Candidatus Poriferisocius sp.]|uniref:Nmad2 family putative nucleotide modification protein n=1 Tax=Candidatus Poriferisocius sp. TaxID=3101276 RepID=UPI003B02E699